jgi:mono/diheme cytochrome c family protein
VTLHGRRRRLARWALWSLGALLTVVSGAVLYAIAVPPRYPARALAVRIEPNPDRVARGKALASVLFCTQCHADPATGALTGKVLSEIPGALSPAASSANITNDPEKGIGSWSDGELVYFLRTGIDREGSLAPPWMPRLPLLAEEDVFDLVAFLRSDDPSVRPSDAGPARGRLSILGKILMRFSWRPGRYPERPIVAPDVRDRVAYGRYVIQAKGNCFGCHSADFTKLDGAHPERSAGYLGGGNRVNDAGGSPVITPNLTPDPETGIGRWSEVEFIRAVREGLRPDGTPLRGPMQLYKELTPDEVGAVYVYLRTVPPIRNPRPTIAPAADPSPSVVDRALAEGRDVYVKYGCRSCHGDAGVEIGDLRQADRKYATDAALEAWIRRPGDFKPETKMPSFDKAIREDELPPLLAYVRELGRRAARVGGGVQPEKGR